ncbi:MAG TPA: RidA family protein [Candidatus Acidoferrales bacterium]
MSDVSTRRSFVQRFSSMAAGVGVVWTALRARIAGAQPQTAPASSIQKLGYDGKPISGNPRISPVVVHDGLIYVSGQGANDNGKMTTSYETKTGMTGAARPDANDTTPDNLDITAHTQKVMDNVKALVEAAGGDMDNVLCLNVYLASLDYYEAMNKAYTPYFPHRAPARCAISVAEVPGGSLLEVNCIAAVVKS